MKLKRLLASVLALLLVVSILPIGAMAKDIGKEGPPLEDNPTVPENNEVITNNYGTIEINRPHATSNPQNLGKIENNYGVVKENTKDRNTPQEGEITNNYGTVEYNNRGIVKNNESSGVVGKKEADGTVAPGTGNNGTIETNNGTVISNNVGGKVEINGADGKIEINDGTVGKEDENCDFVESAGNFGTINTNNGDIYINHNQVDTNASGGYIFANSGKVDTNETTLGLSKTMARSARTVVRLNITVRLRQSMTTAGTRNAMPTVNPFRL